MKKTLFVLFASAMSAMAAHYEALTTTLPLLNDGEPTTAMDFKLTTEKVRTIVGFELDTTGTTEISDLVEISVVMRRRAGDLELGTHVGKDGVVVIDKHTEIPAGAHTCSVVVRTKKGADLTHRIGLQLTAIKFKDGENIKPEKSESGLFRLAYAIHKRGQHDCHTFRIPAMTKANDGTLLAVFDMRYHSARDLQEHMDIGLSRSLDGGQTWSKPEPIMDMGEYGGKPQKENGCSDPGIIVDTKTGEVIVTACWTHGKPNTHQWRGKGSEPGLGIDVATQFMAVRSKDHGQTWSKPENWTKALKDPAWYLFAPAPGNGITMADGTLVMPTQGRDENGLPFSNITWSKDHGKTWTVSEHARDNTTECAVAELSNGSLMLSMRDNRNRKEKSETNGRAVGVTADLGKSWTKHSADHGALPEPVCMASLISHVTAEGKRLLLFSNPHHKKSRRDMTIQLSTDEGETWPNDHHVLLDSGHGYGYSSLVMIDESTVGIVYESSAADMTFQMVPLADLKGQ